MVIKNVNPVPHAAHITAVFIYNHLLFQSKLTIDVLLHNPKSLFLEAHCI